MESGSQPLTAKLLKDIIKSLRKKKVPKYIKMKQDFWDQIKFCFHPLVREKINNLNGVSVEIDNNIKKNYKFVY